MRLKNKTAIITGGASGFGKGIVEKFIKEGANVVIADINYNLAKELEDSIGKNAQRKIRERFSLKEMLNQTLEVYEELIERKKHIDN